MKSFSSRELEQISAYLDGQLSQADSARLESRIKTDPELRSLYESLRQSQALLRKLPARRAPRDFRLSAKMARVKPPLPRAFPLFRLASALATILFFLGYAINLISPLNFSMAAPTSFAYDSSPAQAEMPVEAPTEAMEEPTEAMEAMGAMEATQTPTSKLAPTEEPFVQQDSYAETATSEPMGLAFSATETVLQPAPDSVRTANAPVAPPSSALPVPVDWLFGFLGVAVVSGAGAFLIRVQSEQKWSKTHAAAPTRLGARDLLMVGVAVIAVVLLAIAVYWMSNGFVVP